MNRQHLENVVGSLYYAIEYIDNIEARLKEAEEVIRFYSIHKPHQYPEGYYEINLKEGEGGYVPHGTKARTYLEKYKELEKDV